jgi:hypothetical protein
VTFSFLHLDLELLWEKPSEIYSFSISWRSVGRNGSQQPLQVSNNILHKFREIPCCTWNSDTQIPVVIYLLPGLKFRLTLRNIQFQSPCAKAGNLRNKQTKIHPSSNGSFLWGFGQPMNLWPCYHSIEYKGRLVYNVMMSCIELSVNNKELGKWLYISCEQLGEASWRYG